MPIVRSEKTNGDGHRRAVHRVVPMLICLSMGCGASSKPVPPATDSTTASAPKPERAQTLFEAQNIQAVQLAGIDQELQRLRERADSVFNENKAMLDSVLAAGVTEEEERMLQNSLENLRRATRGAYRRGHIHLLMSGLRSYLSDASRLNGQTKQLSWRVHLLPFIEQQQLYNRFHLDEAWDSPHNITLLDQMPRLYGQLDDDEEQTKTRFLALDGPAYLGTAGALKPLAAVQDPEDDTIALVVVSSKQAVPWTKPADLPFSESLFDSVMEEMPAPEFWISTIEGAVMPLHHMSSFAAFHAAATIAGDEPAGVDRMIKESIRLKKAE